MSAHASSRPAAVGLQGLERSLPLTQLPRMIAATAATEDVAVLDDLPLARFSPETLRRVLDPATQAMVDTVVAELDDQHGVSIRGGPLERHIRQAVREAIRQFAAAVAQGRPELDRSFFRELGRKHARAGLPLSELAALFTRGGIACWRSVHDLHRRGDLPDALLEPSTEVVLVLAQELCSAAIEGYTEAVSTAGTAVRSRRVELVRRLVEPEPPDRFEVQAQARAIGWELPERLAVAVTSVDVRFPGCADWPGQVLGAPHGARWCLLCPQREGEVVEPAVPDGVTLAVGPVVSWERAHESLRLAEDLLRLADAGVVEADGKVLRSSDHATELVLAHHPIIAGELIQTMLGPLVELPAHRRGPLVETLEAWVRQPGHHTVLAEELHVSVRTVRYRVDRLRELLGEVVDDPDQRLVLALAVRALQCAEPTRVIVLDEPVEPVASRT